MYEYIVTAFKVVVGVITNDRLAIAALIALGLMLIWVVFSLVFSFQARFARGAKNINNYVSRNGLNADSREGLLKLVKKMPSEFQRGFNNYEKDPSSLPSSHIKRFESLDVELSGGVFNQNRSILKTYINFIFVGLLVFSLAILPGEEALSGYSLAEALIIPLLFVFIAKVMYYVYTAIRQYQYHNAVDDFNDMLDNLDKSAFDFASSSIEPAKVEHVSSSAFLRKGEIAEVYEDTSAVKSETAGFENSEDMVSDDVSQDYVEPTLNIESETHEQEPQTIDNSEPLVSGLVDAKNSGESAKAVSYGQVEEQVNMQELENTEIEEQAKANENLSEVETEAIKEPNATELDMAGEQTEEPIEEQIEASKQTEKVDEANTNAEALEEAGLVNSQQDEGEQAKESDSKTINKDGMKEEEMEENKIEDNFNLDFASLFSEEELEKPKRGRGRPRKEVSASGELVITNDKEFEDALVRAEKLMRKNEEPLSASQTKRIEKQIKELVDAMTKYKEGK